MESGRWLVLHDYWFQPAGAERVAADLCSAVGTGTLHVLGGLDESMATEGLTPRYMLPSILRRPDTYHAASMLVPLVAKLASPIEGNVLYSSYAFAHHWPCTGQRVVYCHSPLRQLWAGRSLYEAEWTSIRRFALRYAGSALRRVDAWASRNASQWVAASSVVAERIFSAYGVKTVDIVPPPVREVFRLCEAPRPKAELLFVGRLLEPVKRLSLLLDVMSDEPGWHLTVIGDGPDRARLSAAAPSNVSFVGWQPLDEVSRYMRNSTCVVVPSVEDYGLVGAEALACGTPVVLPAQSGGVDYVQPGENGVLFEADNPTSLRKAVRRVLGIQPDPRSVSESVRHLSRTEFTGRIRDVLESVA